MNAKTPAILLLGPALAAVSGVSTHLNILLASSLGQAFRLKHFQVGREGHQESVARRIVRLLISPWALAATILAGRVDIVHINTSLNRRAYWRDLAYLVMARLCGARVVYQVHGGDLPEQFAGHGRLRRALLRATWRLPDVIVVLARCELAAYREFLPGNNIKLLPNAIDSAPYATLDNQNRGAHSLVQLLYIGRLAREKGLYEALQGLHLALAQGVAARLVVAGSGPEETRLKNFARQLGLSGSVDFVGPVSGAAKLKWLGESDILLLPSYAEGLPYALLEGMAAGLPVIATRVGAIPDVVGDGVHGVFVAPRDVKGIARSIKRLAGDPASLAKMSAACRLRVASCYSITGMAGEFSRLYAEIFSMNSPENYPPAPAETPAETRTKDYTEAATRL
jgi:glycosyltransferase involved in cell wall biosynthesis